MLTLSEHSSSVDGRHEEGCTDCGKYSHFTASLALLVVVPRDSTGIHFLKPKEKNTSVPHSLRCIIGPIWPCYAVCVTCLKRREGHYLIIPLLWRLTTEGQETTDPHERHFKSPPSHCLYHCLSAQHGLHSSLVATGSFLHPAM